jgi:hypothetical protein
MPLALLGIGATWAACGSVATGLFKQSLWEPGAGTQFCILVGVYACGAALLLACFQKRRGLGLMILALATVLATCGVSALGTSLLMFTAAYALGDRLCLGLEAHARGRLWVGAVALLCGLGLITLGACLALHFPVNYRGIYMALLMLPIILRWRRLGQAVQTLRAHDWQGLNAGWLLMFACVLFAHLAWVGLPERYYDALAVHLFVPTNVAHQGRFGFDFQHYIWALMPNGADADYTVCYVLGGETAARLFNAGVFALACLLMFIEARTQFGMSAALIISSVFATMPLGFLETASLFVENLLMAFLLAATLLLWRIRKAPETGLRCMAILLGAAALVKFPALALSVPLALLAVILCWNSLRSKKHILYFAVLTLLIGALPYGYAWTVTGNPLYPYMNAVFKSPYFDATTNFSDPLYKTGATWNPVHALTFYSSRYLEGSNGALGLAFVLFAPLLVGSLIVRRNRYTLVLFLLSVFYLAVVGSQEQYLRYLYPVFPLLFLLAADGLWWLHSAAGGHRMACALVLAALLSSNLYLRPAAGWMLRTVPYRALISASSRQELLAAEVPQRCLNDLINSTCGTNSRVLYIGQPVGAGLAGTALYANWYDLGLLYALHFANTPAALRTLLKDNRCTHVVFDPIHVDDAMRLQLAQDFAHLEDDVKEIKQLNGVTLFEVKN